MNPSPVERANRIGRRLGIGLFALCIGGFTIVCSAQILRQGFASSREKVDTDCRTGVLELVTSLNRARQTGVANGADERVRLAQFRDALSPEWQKRDALEKLCAVDPMTRTAFADLDRLRWAEEHAIRFESVELAKDRHRVLVLEQTLRRALPGSP